MQNCNTLIIVLLYLLFVLMVIHCCVLILSPTPDHYDDFVEEGFV